MQPPLWYKTKYFPLCSNIHPPAMSPPPPETTDIFTFYVYTYTHGRVDWFRIGKGVHQGSLLPPCLFNLYAEYIMRNAGLEETQAGIKSQEKYQ